MKRGILKYFHSKEDLLELRPLCIIRLVKISFDNKRSKKTFEKQNRIRNELMNEEIIMRQFSFAASNAFERMHDMRIRSDIRPILILF